MTPSGDTSTEFKRRLGLAYARITPIAEYLKEAVIPAHTKALLMHQQILSVLLYASETWVLRAAECKRLQTFQHRMLRRMYGIRPRVTVDDADVKHFSQMPTAQVLKRANQQDILTTWLHRRRKFALGCQHHDLALPERAIFEVKTSRRARATCKLHLWTSDAASLKPPKDEPDPSP